MNATSKSSVTRGFDLDVREGVRLSPRGHTRLSIAVQLYDVFARQMKKPEHCIAEALVVADALLNAAEVFEEKARAAAKETLERTERPDFEG